VKDSLGNEIWEVLYEWEADLTQLKEREVQKVEAEVSTLKDALEWIEGEVGSAARLNEDDAIERVARETLHLRYLQGLTDCLCSIFDEIGEVRHAREAQEVTRELQTLKDSLRPNSLFVKVEIPMQASNSRSGT
jgi:hypothetical protein